MHDILGIGLEVAIVVISAIGIGQMILVPLMAVKRGRDGAAWFMITMIWLWFNTILALVMAIGGLLAIEGAKSGTTEGLLWGLGGFVVYAGIGCGPMWVLMIAGKWKPKFLPRDPRRPVIQREPPLRTPPSSSAHMLPPPPAIQPQPPRPGTTRRPLGPVR